jgi:phosphoribosyl 1,2-cyclic phosphodiesterase
MSLYITSLNSGSNGNCYYIGNDREAVLVDAGISCKETERRMERLGLVMDRVKAIFVSHEHADHINGIPVLSKKYRLPVYITTATLRNSGIRLDQTLIRSFSAGEAVAVGELTVTAFTKLHDAVEPHSFIVASKGIKIGVFTDIGEPCQEVIRHFQQCRAAFLEANYDERMLHEGRYPIYLKRRISGNQGHLSNTQALELFKTHKAPWLSHLLLSHLSKENNRPELARELFLAHCDGTEIIIASREVETAVYKIVDGGPDMLRERPQITAHDRPQHIEQFPDRAVLHPGGRQNRRRNASAANPQQFSLF